MENKKEPSLELLKDIPAFDEGYEGSDDVFNHKAYADSLVNIIKNNPAPLIVGLLGPWGCGKSSIFNIFRKNIGDEHKVVYFNAWKYSNDSFRYQFLFECSKKIEGAKSEERIKKIQQRVVSDYVQKPKLFWNWGIVGAMLGVVLLSIAIYKIFGNVVIGTMSGIILSVILKDFIPNLIQVNIPLEVKQQQFLLPKQFEDELSDIMRGEKKNIIFIIDDIDRCPAHTIMEILDSAKTFFSNACATDEQKEIKSNCYFIFAMDDTAVTTVLRKERSREYKNEHVLKFFDVTIRMNPIDTADLLDFSKKIADKARVSPEVVSTAIYGGLNTPRKIKHFVNAFKVLEHVTTQRLQDGIFSCEINEEFRQGLAKLLVLEMVFPDEFEKICDDFGYWDQLQKDAVSWSGSKDLERIETTKNPHLLEYLWATKYIEIESIDSYLYLKIPQNAAGFKNYTRIKQAIMKDDKKYISELCEELKNSKEALNSLLRNLLGRHTTDKIKRSNILSSSLRILKLAYSKGELISDINGLIVNNLVCHRNVYDFDFSDVRNFFDFIGDKKKLVSDLINICIEDIRRQKNPEYVARFIDHLYISNFMSRQRAKRINEILSDNSLASDFAIQVLEAMKEHPDIVDRVPDTKAVNSKLVVNIDNPDKQTDNEYFETIYKVLEKFWHVDYIPDVNAKSLAVLKNANSSPDNKMGKSLKIVLRLLCLIDAQLPQSVASQLQEQILSLRTKIYVNLPEDEKVLFVKAYSIINAVATTDNTANIVKDALLLGDKNIDGFIRFAVKHKSKVERWDQLLKNMASSVLTSALASLDDISKRKFEIMYRIAKKTFDENQLKQLIERIFSYVQPTCFQLWAPILVLISGEYGKLKNEIISKALYTLNHNFHKAYSDIIFDEILLKVVVDDAEKKQVGDSIFEMAKDINSGMKQAFGVSKLKSVIGFYGDGKSAKIESVVSSIEGSSADIIIQHHPLLKEFCLYKDLWTLDTVDDMVKIIKKMMTSHAAQSLELLKGVVSKLSSAQKKEIKARADTDIKSKNQEIYKVIQEILP